MASRCKEGAMKRRWVSWTILAVGLVFLALAATNWLLSPPPGAVNACDGRVSPGMTAREVEAVLGRHPFTETMNQQGYSVITWDMDEEGAITVEFVDGRVSFARWMAPPLRRPAPLAGLRAWLGW